MGGTASADYCRVDFGQAVYTSYIHFGPKRFGDLGAVVTTPIEAKCDPFLAG